jgi:hypothetical protein
MSFAALLFASTLLVANADMLNAIEYTSLMKFFDALGRILFVHCSVSPVLVEGCDQQCPRFMPSDNCTVGDPGELRLKCDRGSVTDMCVLDRVVCSHQKSKALSSARN